MGEDQTGSGVINAYEELIATSTLKGDLNQRTIVLQLQALADRLVAKQNSKSGFGSLFSRGNSGLDMKDNKGLYIWGDVGRGKTMLMDLFFEQVDFAKKRRVHFHEFMDELHRSIGEFRQDTRRKKKHFDPIAAAVSYMVQDVKLLCFDEFHVTDITNAMLLGRLFEKLFEAGIVVVATSNVEPDRLYHNGLNRQLFLPFIELLKQTNHILHLDAAVDYRLDKLSRQPVFHFGSGREVATQMEAQWRVLTGGQRTRRGEVLVLGRQIVVPKDAMGCARFDFSDLCEVPLGARDYLAISHAYHTLMIDNVPQFEQGKSSAAKRFIQLIDTLYDRGVKLVASFEVELDDLSRDKDTGFEFKRTVSRLHEMASVEYLGGVGQN